MCNSGVHSVDTADSNRLRNYLESLTFLNFEAMTVSQPCSTEFLRPNKAYESCSCIHAHVLLDATLELQCVEG